MRFSKFRWSSRFLGIGLSLGVGSACSEDSRSEPTPRQMCETLASECGGLGHDNLDDCQEIGSRGLKEAAQQDQCYAFYDGCIDECRFVKRWGLQGDAGNGGDNGASDGGGPPAEDSGAEDSDAATAAADGG